MTGGDLPRTTAKPTERATMATANLNLHEIENAHEYLLRAEQSLELDQDDVLCEDDLPPMRDEDVPDKLWLGAVALFVTESGFDGNAIVRAVFAEESVPASFRREA
jgi:hypothetical protein